MHAYTGLIFSYKLVEKAVFDILITHLTYEWKDHDLRKAAILVNLQEGSYAVLQIFFAFVADAYSGLFKMVVCSTTLYIIVSTETDTWVVIFNFVVIDF